MASKVGTGRLLSTEAEFWAEVGRDESLTVEFKERLPKPGRLQEPMVALANARGGRIVVGVSDRVPRQVVGVSWGQAQEEQLQEAARATQPPMSPRTSMLVVDGRTVVFVAISPVERGWVHTSDGRLLVRAGPTNRALVGHELLRFVSERGAEPVEDVAVPGVTVDDLRPDLLRPYLRARLRKTRMSAPAALRDLGFVGSDGSVRLAAVLMFGKAPQAANRRFGIVVSRFEGLAGGGARLRDRHQLEGPLPDLVAEADRMIYDEMRRDAVVRGLVREEVPEFPPIAMREALVNAVAHRDYSLRGSAIDVRLFDDAVEIESPGCLPAYVTVENLRTAQYSRNERIMDCLQRLGFVEEAGQGIDRMITEMEEALLDPPEFEERDASFVVRLRGRSLFAAEDRLWAARFREMGLGGHAMTALVYARRQGTISNEDLRNLRHLDRDASRSVLQDLVNRGLVTTLGRGRGSRYALTDRAVASAPTTTLDDQAAAVLRHARRQGSVVNADVRGLLGLEREESRKLLERLVGEGHLTPVGERRGRRYLPTTRPAGDAPPDSG
jgi:ATP-dependent DNA helicase RecG